MKTALLQLCSSDSPAENLVTVRAFMREAAAAGAKFICTPEVTNCVSNSNAHQQSVLQLEQDDQTLRGVQEEAAELDVYVSIGSLALKSGDVDGRFANRSFVISPTGDILGRYDKIHMFDVEVSATETYRESAGYRPGNCANVLETPFGILGQTICYDVRFPHLHRSLAQAGAEILLIPAAFSSVTGAAHWEPLLRARAIENGAYVLAAAQCRSHHQQDGTTRKTHGHSLVVSPWGEVLSDGGAEPGITYVDLDRAEVAQARRRIPSLTHDRAFEPPK